MDKESAHYEFRIFTSCPGSLEEQIRRLFTRKSERESVETYILSRGSDRYNTKIRSGKFDVKVLLGIERGLEKWARLCAEPFPLDREVIAGKVFSSLEIAPPPMSRHHYTAEQFLDELVMPREELAAVRVSKKRTLFIKGCCEAESAALEVDGDRIYTVALESGEMVPLLELVEDFGLAGCQNTNYISALKQLHGRALLPLASPFCILPSHDASHPPPYASCSDDTAS